MLRHASLGAVVVSACLVSIPSWADSHRSGRSANVLDRVDRILDTACTCTAGSAGCDCARPARRIFEKLSGTRHTLQLPTDARLDASAGVFL